MEGVMLVVESESVVGKVVPVGAVDDISVWETASKCEHVALPVLAQLCKLNFHK
jgi:hypothetical protein